VLLIAIALMVAVIKMSFCAIWFAKPLVAAGALRLFERLSIRGLVARAFVVIMLAPGVLSTAVLSVVQAATRMPTRIPATAAGASIAPARRRWRAFRPAWSPPTSISARSCSR
jgi:hypothetical protein